MKELAVTFREVKVGDVVIEKTSAWLVQRIVDVIVRKDQPHKTYTLFEGEEITIPRAREIKINQLIWS